MFKAFLFDNVKPRPCHVCHMLTVWSLATSALTFLALAFDDVGTWFAFDRLVRYNGTPFTVFLHFGRCLPRKTANPEDPWAVVWDLVFPPTNNKQVGGGPRRMLLASSMHRAARPPSSRCLRKHTSDSWMLAERSLWVPVLPRFTFQTGQTQKRRDRCHLCPIRVLVLHRDPPQECKLAGSKLIF